jgi:hypothetical protein
VKLRKVITVVQTSAGNGWQIVVVVFVVDFQLDCSKFIKRLTPFFTAIEINKMMNLIVPVLPLSSKLSGKVKS